MAPPVLTTVTPDEGRSLGDTYVVIVGTNFKPPSTGARTEFFFNGISAKEVAVISATEARCLSPGGPVQAVDLTARNVTPNPPNPDIVEPALLPLTFTYKRPDISSPNVASYSFLATIMRKVVEDFQRTVLEATTHDMHAEYADAQDVLAPVPQTHLAPMPSLKLLGPQVDEDPFYRQDFNDRYSRAVVPGGEVRLTDLPIPTKLTFTYVGVGRTSVEAANLLEAVLSYVRASPLLVVQWQGHAYELELAGVWDSRADFRGNATRQAVFQFTGQFCIRGAMLLVEQKLSETRQVGDPGVIVTLVPK